MVDGREVARALMALDDETFAKVVATGDFERLGANRALRSNRTRTTAAPGPHPARRGRSGSVAP